MTFPQVLRAALLAAALTGCSAKQAAVSAETTPQPVAQPDAAREAEVDPHSSPTPDTDELFQQFLSAPAMGSDTSQPWDDARSAKMREAKAVNNAYKSQLESADRDKTAHIQYQRARIFLAVACQMVASPPRDGATEQDALEHQQRSTEGAFLMIAGADEALRYAVEADGAKSPEAAQLLLVIRTAGAPATVCEQTESLWKPG